MRRTGLRLATAGVLLALGVTAGPAIAGAAEDEAAAQPAELVRLTVRPGQEAQFEAAFRQAQRIIASMPGYLGHELQRCVERPGEYLLLVRWASLQAHEVGFRKSPQYHEWKRLLHHFYDPFPTVEHYRRVYYRSGYSSSIATHSRRAAP